MFYCFSSFTESIDSSLDEFTLDIVSSAPYFVLFKLIMWDEDCPLFEGCSIGFILTL